MRDFAAFVAGVALAISCVALYAATHHSPPPRRPAIHLAHKLPPIFHATLPGEP